MLTSLNECFKKTVMSVNNDVNKCHTQIQKKEGKLSAAKSKLVLAKMEFKTIKKVYVTEVGELKGTHEVSIKKLCHKKNVLTTKVRKLEAELKKKDIEKKTKPKKNL